MRYWIEYADGRCCNFANSRKDVVARLEVLQKIEEATEETQVEKNLPEWNCQSGSMAQINEILLYQTPLQQHEIKCVLMGIVCDRPFNPKR